MSAREALIAELRAHALVIGDVVLTSGRRASYYIDAKRAILLPAGFAALAELLAAQARDWGATAVGGMTMGADAPACAALAGGAECKAFFVRKDVKEHGLSRRIEGPPLLVGPLHGRRGRRLDWRLDDRGNRGAALEGHTICGVVTILDRLMGGREAIEAATDAPYSALTTIDDVYPGHPR